MEFCSASVFSFPLLMLHFSFQSFNVFSKWIIAGLTTFPIYRLIPLVINFVALGCLSFIISFFSLNYHGRGFYVLMLFFSMFLGYLQSAIDCIQWWEANKNFSMSLIVYVTNMLLCFKNIY